MCCFLLRHVLPREGEMDDGGISRLYILNDVLQQNQRGRMRWKLDEGR